MIFAPTIVTRLRAIGLKSELVCEHHIVKINLSDIFIANYAPTIAAKSPEADAQRSEAGAEDL